MEPGILLLDSSSYFRLARSIHPLLNQRFGERPGHCLYVIDDLEKEFLMSSRLRRKFSWVDAQEYRENRACPLPMSRDQRRERTRAESFMTGHARAEGYGVSSVDIRALATAYTLGITLVTDDKDLSALSRAFGVKAFSTLMLLKLMVREKHIGMDLVRQIVEYWQFEKDIPANFREEFLKLFGESPPFGV